MKQKKIIRQIYWQLASVPLFNIIIYFVWQWIMEESPSLPILIVFQIIWNIMIAGNIVRMIKSMNEE